LAWLLGSAAGHSGQHLRAGLLIATIIAFTLGECVYSPALNARPLGTNPTGSEWASRGRYEKASQGHGRLKMSWVPIRRQLMCAWPGLTSSPYSKVARPSGAQVTRRYGRRGSPSDHLPPLPVDVDHIVLDQHDPRISTMGRCATHCGVPAA
jgi:hypothetical protein